jgi:hypothetical protein
MIIKSLVTRIKEGIPYTVGFILANLTLTPTTHQWVSPSGIEDYGLKF